MKSTITSGTFGEVPVLRSFSMFRLLLLTALLLGWCGQRSAPAHAGHDDIPEASVGAVGEIAPRFYARSEAIDATLVLDGPPQSGAAHLYLMDHSSNRPIAANEIRVEQITPDIATIQAENSPTTGIINLTGLTDLTETATLSVEISSADMFEILSFNNVIRPEELKSEAAESNTLTTESGRIPAYLLNALLAVNALVAVLAVFALMKFLFRRSRRSKTQSSSTLPVILCATLTLCSAPGLLFAHAGDEHTGEGLASPGGLPGRPIRHFVSVETQLRGEVFTSTAQTLQLPKTFSALGRVTVRPDMEAAITAPADGLLLKSPDEEKVPIIGQQVTKGDVLVLLQMMIPAEDKVTIGTEKALAEAELNQARQQTQLARQELERSVQLGIHVSQSERDQLRTAYEVAREKEVGLSDQIRTLTAALEGGTSGVKTLEIRAPLSGVVSESHSTLGEYVNSGKPLFRIININELFVEADIFESDMRLIDNARTASVYVEGYPDSQFQGTLHSISPEIDPLRRTAKVLFEVKNTEGHLRGGMFARLEIAVSEPEPTMVVPKSAIVSGDNLKQVYRKISPELFEAVPVIVERFLDVNAVIRSPDIKEGDVIVTQGQYQVRMSPAVGVEN